MVTQMMAIPGKSREEADVVKFITSRLLGAGVPEKAISVDTAHLRIPGGGNTGNLIVRLPGTMRGPRRLLMAHIDTVPLCVGCRPVAGSEFIESTEPGTALGGDDRAGASVILLALETLMREQLPHPPLTFFWPVQEEIGLRGSCYVSVGKLGKPQLCFNWDGNAPNSLTVGATGDYDIAVTINGIPSHAGAHPEQGVSAITIAALAIADLQEKGWLGLVSRGKLSGTSNVGVISGGDATNVVTPRVTIRAEARSHDPAFRERIVREIEKAFTRAAKKLKSSLRQTGSIEFQTELKYEAFRLDDDAPCVHAAAAAIEAVGMTPQTVVSNGGLDANWMTNHGLPTVTLGCGQRSIHTADEKLHIDSFLTACEIARQLATGIAAPPSTTTKAR